MNEAERVFNNMALVPDYNGVASKDTVNEILERFGDTVFCRGSLRHIIFTSITSENFSFRTKLFTYHG